MREGAEGVSRGRVLLAFAAIYTVWGSTYLAIRFAVETLPPFLMAGVRFLIAGAAMYAWARARGGERPTRAQWVGAAVVGALLLGGGNGGVVWAELRVPSGLAALLVATVPLWMVLLEWGAGGVRPTRGVVAGLLLGFLGLGVLVGPADLLGGRGADAVGTVALVFASVSWAVGSVVAKRVPLPRSPLLGTGAEMIAGGALLLVVGTLTGEWAAVDLAAASARSLLSFLYLVVFGSWVGFTAYVWLLRHVEIAKVSTYAYVNPVVAVFLGWAFAGEPITPRTLVAAGVIVAAVAFITVARRAPPLERAETAPADAALARAAAE